MIKITNHSDLTEALSDTGVLKDAEIASNKLFTNCVEVKKMKNVVVGKGTKMSDLLNLVSMKNVTIGDGVTLKGLHNLVNLDVEWSGQAKFLNLSSMRELVKMTVPKNVILHGFIKIDRMTDSIIDGSVYHYGGVDDLKGTRVTPDGLIALIQTETTTI